MCPNCGYCPTCGRSNHTFAPYPWYQGPYWYWQPNIYAAAAQGIGPHIMGQVQSGWYQVANGNLQAVDPTGQQGS